MCAKSVCMFVADEGASLLVITGAYVCIAYVLLVVEGGYLGASIGRF